MAKKYVTPTDQLRAVIAACKKNRNRIGIETGIDPAVLCRFMQHKGGVSADVLDTLGRYFGLTITAQRPDGPA
jgi:hypothetical protein